MCVLTAFDLEHGPKCIYMGQDIWIHVQLRVVARVFDFQTQGSGLDP